MLSGQEQYYWERAGYFVRRAALDADALARVLAAGAEERAPRVTETAGVVETARALLGEAVEVAPAAPLARGAGWRRGLGAPAGLTAAAEMAWLLSPRLLCRLEGAPPEPPTVELRLVDSRAAARTEESHP